MVAITGVARLFLIARRVVEVGVPIALGLWFVFYFALGGVGMPELMVLLGFPLMISASVWLVAWILESVLLPRGERQR